MRIYLRAGGVMILAVLAMPAVGDTGIDLHWLWDDRCAACHGHSGDFSRKSLSVSSGRFGYSLFARHQGQSKRNVARCRQTAHSICG